MRLTNGWRSSFTPLLLLALVAGCPGPAPVPDGGSPDAATSDGGGDAAPACETAADCDDGLYCNGAEACEAGRCMAGTLDCDDGVACTRDLCSEALRACTHSAPDVDGDGFGDALCVDDGGVPLGDDCADDDAQAFPGNLEVCDTSMHDEDCDPATLGDLDNDGDGFVSIECCNGTACGDDCDDARDATHPGGAELCDGLDQDCDGDVDDGVLLAGFSDRDRDGWGDTALPLASCPSAVGWSPMGGDCNDDPTSATATSQSPGQPEICDGIRNDCGEGAADVGAIAVPWYGDLDGDGFGSALSGVTVSCTPVTSASLLATDCDDANPMRHPAAAELCNAIDDDCSGAPSFLIAPNDTEDDDLDGLADIRCAPLGVDCDDHDVASGPGEVERCDGRDNDCDAAIDEGAMSVVFYRDVDGDGFGAVASGAVVGCMATAGFVPRGGDCNDADAARFPGATERCNAADEDCDTTIDEAPASSMCTPAFTSASACVAGRCTVDACTAGRGDCDHAPLDGCEVDLLTDEDHCGACGNGCPDGAPCLSGTCTRSRVYPASGSASTQARSIAYTIAAPTPSTLYYTTDGSVPGSPTTLSSSTGAVTVTLGNAQQLRWYADFGGGFVEPLQSYTHYTDTVQLPGPADTSTHPRDNWALLAENVSLNGLGPVITVAPGATVDGTASLTTWRQSGGGFCAGCVTYTSLTRSIGPGAYATVACFGEVSSAPVYPGTTTPTPFSFTAPTTPGRYPIYTRLEWDFSCGVGPGSEIGYVIVAAP